MRKKFKTLNRGILLGVLCIVMLLIFLLVQNIQFKKSIPQISQTVKDYVDEVYNQSFNKTKPTKDNMDSLLNEASNIYKKYWANDEFNIENSRGTNLDNLLCYINPKEISDNSSSNNDFYTKSINYEISNIKVKRSNSDMAIVTAQLDTTVNSYGYSIFLSPTEMSHVSGWSGDLDDESNLDTKGKKDKKINDLTYKANIILNLYMVKENDTWKIFSGNEQFTSEDIVLAN